MLDTITAVPLSIGGAVLVTISVIGLRTAPKSAQPEPLTDFVCGAPAPDDSLICAEDIGHYGWHRNGESTWFGDSWDVDHWAETHERPIEIAEPVEELEPTIAAVDWKSELKPKTGPAQVRESDNPESQPDLAEKRPLAEMTVSELRSAAKERGLTGYSKLNKIGLAKLLQSTGEKWPLPTPLKALSEMTHHELKMAARERGIPRYYRLSKIELIVLLRRTGERWPEPKPQPVPAPTPAPVTASRAPKQAVRAVARAASVVGVIILVHSAAVTHTTTQTNGSKDPATAATQSPWSAGYQTAADCKRETGREITYFMGNEGTWGKCWRTDGHWEVRGGK